MSQKKQTPRSIPEGFFHNRGNGRNLPAEGVMLEVIRRTGDLDHGVMGESQDDLESLFWDHEYPDDRDVIAYRILGEDASAFEGFTVWRSSSEGFPFGISALDPVRVRCRDGHVESALAKNFIWRQDGSPADIVAYVRLDTSTPAPVTATVPTPEPATDAPAILEAAAKHMRDRAATYDRPGGERSMAATVTAFNAIVGRAALNESEGWLFMQILKDVRDRQRVKPHRDSLEDCTAYSALKAEARLGEGN